MKKMLVLALIVNTLIGGDAEVRECYEIVKKYKPTINWEIIIEEVQRSALGDPVILEFKNNGFHEIPQGFFSALQKIPLYALSISQHDVSTLPDDFVVLSELRHLNLNWNRFERFPVTILRLKKLESLYIGGNNLTELPSEISVLQSLKKLVVGWNKLTSLPESLSELSELSEIDITGNGSVAIPQSLLQKECNGTLTIKR